MGKFSVPRSSTQARGVAMGTLVTTGDWATGVAAEGVPADFCAFLPAGHQACVQATGKERSKGAGTAHG